MLHSREVTVDVGGVAVLFRTDNPGLADTLERRFARFLSRSAAYAFAFDVTTLPFGRPQADADAEIEVRGHAGCWTMRRGDFSAEWHVDERRGRMTLTTGPYAVDCVLRIVHTLLLSREGGFLLHASSGIRNNRAFLFTGPSGAGKSTIVSVAPPDVRVLTDEISYVRKTPAGFLAFGTPFAGELGDAGEPGCAPIAALFALGRGADNARVPLNRSRAVQTLMRNILFFAHDRELVDGVFDTACRFAADVPAFDLLFAPDSRVWSSIQ